MLEHTVSDLFVERLESMLGFPKTCPHGGTIPAKGELLVEINNLPLSDIKEAGSYLLTRVHDSFELLQYLENMASILETNFKSNSLMVSVILLL